MPRFYFNIITAAGKIFDPEGSELRDVDVARAEAVEDARILMSNALLDGRDISSRSMEICDEAGNILHVIPFTSAFSRFD